MNKSRNLIRLDHPVVKKRSDILKKAKRILTWKNIRKFFLYSIVGFFSFLLLLFAWFAKDLPSPNKINSRIMAESTKILDREGNLIYEVHGDKNRTLISFDEMPKYIKDATVAVEDKEFYKNKGFNIRGIARAFIYNLTHKNKMQGGSGITQQFVKNALLSPERTISRKIKELILSIEIEIVYSKNDILKMYLNEIPYGSNAYGIEAAAKTYFGKGAKELTLAECAALAALPKAPTYYSPYGSHKDSLLARKDMVLDKMAEQGFISKEEAEKAQLEKLAFTKRQESITYPHFVMYVREKLVEKYGEKMVEEGGLRVTTTIDPKKQKIAEDVIMNKAPDQLKKYGASNASLVSIDPKTGQVLAMVGSINYFDDAIDGNVNVGIRDRQPGSSFKPFAYATAWKKDRYGPGSPMFDLKTDFGGNPPYKPDNYDGREHGLQTMRTALSQSLNIPAVKTLYIAGVKETIDTAHDMGITTLNDPDRYGLALVLGGGEVKLLDMVGAFGVFANKGEKKDTTPIIKVENSKGKVLEEYKNTKGKGVLDSQIAYLVSSVLSDNNSRAPIFGSNSPLTFGKSRPVAAKTGTTQEWRDAWTIGYTPSLAGGVWAGNNDNSTMKKGADGVYVAAPLWNEYMTKALEGTPVEHFEKPSGIKKVTLDKVSGKKPIEGSQTVTDEFPSWFKLEKAGSGKGYKINKVDGKLATEDCPPETVQTIYSPQVQAEIPPQDPAYSRWIKPIAAWAKSHGYGTTVIPTEYTNLCGVGNQPSISVSLSSNSISLGESVTATASVNAPLGVSKIEFYLDDSLVGSDTTSPYSKTITPSSSGSHKITAKVKDNGANTASDSASVYVGGGGPTELVLSKSGSTFTANYSGAGEVFWVKLYLVRPDSSKEEKIMTDSGSGWVWTGSIAGFSSAYSEASTGSGPKTSNTVSW